MSSSIVNSFNTAPINGQTLEGQYENVPLKYQSFSISIDTDVSGVLTIQESYNGTDESYSETHNISAGHHFENYSRKFDYLKVSFENNSGGDSSNFFLDTIYRVDGALSNSVAVSGGNINVSNITACDTSNISGSVSVSNFPATQTVDGSVSVSNLPATQTVDGSVSIDSLPSSQTFSYNHTYTTESVQGVAVLGNNGGEYKNLATDNVGRLYSVAVGSNAGTPEVLNCDSNGKLNVNTSVQATYNTTPPSLTDGQSTDLQCNDNGELIVDNGKNDITLSSSLSTSIAGQIQAVKLFGYDSSSNTTHHALTLDGDDLNTKVSNITTCDTDNIGGSVSVSNFPATQTVDGSVSVSNFPATQTVDGSVSVSNFPATQTVDGSVSVSNFPATQTVDGSVSVSNFPATQTVDGSVSVSNQISGFATQTTLNDIKLQTDNLTFNGSNALEVDTKLNTITLVSASADDVGSDLQGVKLFAHNPAATSFSHSLEVDNDHKLLIKNDLDVSSLATETTLNAMKLQTDKLTFDGSDYLMTTSQNLIRKYRASGDCYTAFIYTTAAFSNSAGDCLAIRNTDTTNIYIYDVEVTAHGVDNISNGNVPIIRLRTYSSTTTETGTDRTLNTVSLNDPSQADSSNFDSGNDTASATTYGTLLGFLMSSASGRLRESKDFSNEFIKLSQNQGLVLTCNSNTSTDNLWFTLRFSYIRTSDTL